MINENNNALEIEIFLSFFFWPFQPFRAMAILTVHEQCDVWFVASLFIFYFPAYNELLLTS